MKFTQKQREHLKRPRPILFCIIVGLFCSPWLALFSIDAYLRQQQVQTDLQATAFFAQVPVHRSNPSAEHIDRLGALLGLGPNVNYPTPVSIDREAAFAFIAIESTLNEFLHSQSSKISGPFEAPPPELASYINTYQPIIDDVRIYLRNHEAPRWEMDSSHMADPDYPSPSFFNVRSLQNILLLSAMQAHQQGQEQEVFDTLEASWQLNKTIAERSDLSSQVLVAVISAQLASLLRHLDHVPAHWQTRLQQQSHVQPIIRGLTFETWLRYRITKNAWIPTAVTASNAGIKERFSALFANRFSAQSYFKLISLNNTQTAHRALEQLIGLNVCTTPQVIAERRLANIKTASWNEGGGISSIVIAKRWQTAGMRSLSLELSHHVLKLKAHFEATGTWPTSHAPIASTTCPNETWIYTPNKDGSISLVFSKKLLSPSAIPLSYRSPRPANTDQPTQEQERS